MNFKLDQIKGSDEFLESLHFLLYKSKGKASLHLIFSCLQVMPNLCIKHYNQACVMQAHTRKKDVKGFSGYVYPDGAEVGLHHDRHAGLPVSFCCASHHCVCMQEVERERHQAKLSKWNLNQINALLDVLDMPRGSGEDGAKVCSFQSVLQVVQPCVKGSPKS